MRPQEDAYSVYLSANGGPRSDTFMGRAAVADADAARCVARAVIRARASLDAIRRIDGTLDGQPLGVTLAYEDGWLRRRPLETLRAAFVTPRGVFVAEPSSDEALSQALGAVLDGRSAPRPLRAIDAGSLHPTDAVVAIGVAAQPRSDRHIHRRAWTRGGGPGLGVASAPPWEVVTTCHLAVDGYGHARLASAIFEAEAARGDLASLVAASGLRDRSLPRDAPPSLTDLWTVAARELPGIPPRFADAAYAFGSVIQRVYGRFATIQVPVAPGAIGDAARRRGRVVHGVLWLRPGETRAELAARLPSWLARERAGFGPLARLMRAAATAPMPSDLRRRLLSGGRGSPVATLLAGRGCLSVLRFVDGDTPSGPLVAASMPGVAAEGGGGVVLTVVEHAGGTTATMTHAGPYGDAESMLAEWTQAIGLASPVRKA